MAGQGRVEAHEGSANGSEARFPNEVRAPGDRNLTPFGFVV